MPHFREHRFPGGDIHDQSILKRSTQDRGAAQFLRIVPPRESRKQVGVPGPDRRRHDRGNRHPGTPGEKARWMMIPGFGPTLDGVERSDDNGGGTVESRVGRQEARLDANTWGSHGQHLPVKLLGRNLDHARRHDQQARQEDDSEATDRSPLHMLSGHNAPPYPYPCRWTRLVVMPVAKVKSLAVEARTRALAADSQGDPAPSKLTRLILYASRPEC